MDPNVIFELFHTIGQGGQADVFLARMQGTGTFYAAKVLREAWDPWAVAAFQKEVSRQIRASGNRLVRVVAWNLNVIPPFVILEYMAGGSLADRLEGSGGVLWHPLRALELVRDLAEGLAELHSANVLHLDIKPGNILFDASGRALLNDLGVGATCSPGRMLIVGQFRGTRQYAAPEQLLGVFSHKCDIYPLGVILYELLTGLSLPRIPQNRVLISTLRNDVEPEVHQLVQRLAHPDYRYRPSARETVDLVQREIYRIAVRAARRRALPDYSHQYFRQFFKRVG